MIYFHGEPCTLEELKNQIRVRWQMPHCRGIITACGHDFWTYFN